MNNADYMGIIGNFISCEKNIFSLEELNDPNTICYIYERITENNKTTLSKGVIKAGNRLCLITYNGAVVELDTYSVKEIKKVNKTVLLIRNADYDQPHINFAVVYFDLSNHEKNKTYLELKRPPARFAQFHLDNYDRLILALENEIGI